MGRGTPWQETDPCSFRLAPRPVPTQPAGSRGFPKAKNLVCCCSRQLLGAPSLAGLGLQDSEPFKAGWEAFYFFLSMQTAAGVRIKIPCFAFLYPDVARSCHRKDFLI